MIKFFLVSLLLIFLNACGSSGISKNVTSEDLQTETEKQLAQDQSIPITYTTLASSSIPMLAILLSYNDIQISSSEELWAQKLFGKNEGQLNHYYFQASNGNFEFSQAKESSGTLDNGVVTVQLNKNHPNTDIDNPFFADTAYSDLKNALVALDEKVDFSLYDTDANGAITPDELLLTFIVAGYEDSYEGKHVNKGIWAHQSCISNTSLIPTLDSVTLMSCYDDGNFALFGELHDNTNPHNATIGIIAHELGHSAFDLPDLYNTSNPNNGGIGIFGIMGAGTWSYKNNLEYPGATPTHFCAWSKVFNKWVEPKIESSTSTTLTQTSTSDYDILKIPINSTSYYLLENRNNSGYDRGLYTLDGFFKGGIAIWKIDETKLTEARFLTNSVNTDTNNKGVDLVEAITGDIDSNAGYGNENALYYEGNVNSFLNLVTDISTPASSMTLNIK